MKKTIQTIANTLVIVVVVLSATAIQAGSLPNGIIDWGLGAQNISSINDVNTSGTLVNAYNVGPIGVVSSTVNGVLFAAFPFPADFTSTTVTLGNYNFKESQGALTSYNNMGFGAAPFTSLASEYQTILSTGGSASDSTTLTLTISGLVTGESYLFQCWVNNSSTSTGFNGATLSTTATAGTSVFIDPNTSNTPGGVGQFATGTFVATGSQETIDFTGLSPSDNPLINAFQLRIAPVPEPSVCALMGMGLLMLGMKLRRR